ncbi:MAG: hypothetical protein PHW00_05650 [Clostridia bacterium]|nr:hypothetical protein [Clostridia bacterium]MDD3832120.1 hypothetical protein [Clostridia bacterium]
MKSNIKFFLFGQTEGKAQIIVRIAIMMGITILIQYLTGLAGIQLLTGSFVNLLLLLSVLLSGMVGGACVGIITPFIALSIGLNPNVLLVPFIALSNAILIVAFSLVCMLLRLSQREAVWQRICVLIVAVIVGALLKYLFMYFVCIKLVFPLLFPAPMVNKLSLAWGLLQLATACIGGAVATALYYPLQKVGLIRSVQVNKDGLNDNIER